MKRRTFATLSLLGLVLPLVTEPVHAQPAERPAPAPRIASSQVGADEIVSYVESVYNPIKVLRASFKQRYIIKAYDKTVDSSGSVIFEKPGKMSWFYTNGNRIVSDSKLIKVYENDNKQMYVQPLGNTPYAAVLAFLTGQGSLKQGFKLTRMSSTQMKYPTGYVLRGVPLQPTDACHEVYFYVDHWTQEVRRVLIVDEQGNRNRFDFGSLHAVTTVAPQTFAFTPPPGTRVVQPPTPPLVPSRQVNIDTP